MFRVELAPSARRDLAHIEKTSPDLVDRLLAAMMSLREAPYQGKKLRGDLAGRWSLRVGTYRVIYQVFKNRLLVWVIDLGHRREIYR